MNEDIEALLKWLKEIEDSQKPKPFEQIIEAHSEDIKKIIDNAFKKATIQPSQKITTKPVRTVITGSVADILDKAQFDLTERGNMNYKFINGVERHKEHPTTFEIPSESDKDALQVGDFVKVGVELETPEADGPEGERFWVAINAISTDHTKFIGKISNNLQLADTLGLDHGRNITFKRDEILSVLEK